MVLAISPVAMPFLTPAGLAVDRTLHPSAETATVVDRLPYVEVWTRPTRLTTNGQHKLHLGGASQNTTFQWPLQTK